MKNIEDYRGKKYVIKVNNLTEKAFIYKINKYAGTEAYGFPYFVFLNKHSFQYTDGENYCKNLGYTILEAKDFMKEENKLPEKWVISGKYDEVREWFSKNRTDGINDYETHPNYKTRYFHSIPVRNHYGSYHHVRCSRIEIDTDFTEIDLDTFKQHVLKQDNKPMEEEIKYTVDYVKTPNNKIVIGKLSVKKVKQIDKLCGSCYKYYYNSTDSHLLDECLFIPHNTHADEKYWLGKDYTIISAEQFIKDNTKPIEKSKYFAIKESKNNPLWKEYILWLNKTYDRGYSGNDANAYYGYDGNSCWNGTRISLKLTDFENNPVELTLEQWKSIFVDNNNQTMNKTVKKSEFKKVHDVACDTWKKKCKEYASKDPFSDTIEFTEAQIEEMFNAARADQKPVLEEVFGKREKFTTLADLKIGEILLLNTPWGETTHILKTYDNCVSIQNSKSTWDKNNTSHKGKKLPSGTKIEIIAK